MRREQRQRAHEKDEERGGEALTALDQSMARTARYQRRRKRTKGTEQIGSGYRDEDSR